MKAPWEQIEKANQILKEILPNIYVVSRISYIKLTNAKGYWANIGRIPGKNNTWGIHISEYNFSLIKDEKDFHNKLQSCILHELIHTIPGCDNHGNEFKRICNLVSAHYPEYQPNCKDNNLKLLEEKIQKPKYLLKCSVCDYEYYYCRKPKYSAKNYVCKCGNRSLKLIPI